MKNDPAATATSRQRELLQVKRVADRLSARAWLDLLAPLARLDVAGDRTRRTWRAWIIRGGVVAFFGLFALGFAPSFLWPVPAAGLAVAVGAGLRYHKLLQLDLSNNLSQLVLPLLRVLEEETGHDSLLTLELDLRAPDVADKLERTERPPPEGGYFDIVARHYRDPWMTGRAELIGGGRLEWAIVDQVVAVVRRRRGSSGKTKSKKKYKKRCLMTVGLSLPEARYAVDDGPAGAASDGHEVRVKTRATKQTLKVARVVKLASLDPPPVAAFLDLMASVFRRATPVPPDGARP